MSVPDNTTARARRDPLGTLAEIAVGGPELQEARGQAEIARSEVIPTDMGGHTEEEFVALGFKLGPVVDGDPIFRRAELPEGWRREGSSHAMWSYIVDGDGYERCSIFYKAAFYDRSAHIVINAVPTTRAQYEARVRYEDANGIDYPAWGDLRLKRQGRDLVATWIGYEVGEDGKRVWQGPACFRTGATRSVTISPTGEILREDTDLEDGSGTTTITLMVEDDTPE